MPSSGYTSHFSSEAVSTILHLPGRKRFKVLDIADRIAAHPIRIGDYPSTDATGRKVQNLMVDEFLFTYWIDDAAKQVRITEILVVYKTANDTDNTYACQVLCLRTDSSKHTCG